MLKKCRTISIEQQEISNDSPHLLNKCVIKDSNAAEYIEREEVAAEIRSLLNRLPAEQREVAILRHYAHLQFNDIGKITNSPRNTVLGRMRYALTNLRKLMKEQEAA